MWLLNSTLLTSKLILTVGRDDLWKMVRHIVVSEKVINIIKTLYNNTKCCVTIAGKLTEWLAVLVGLIEGAPYYHLKT